jgi:hypothetical protein
LANKGQHTIKVAVECENILWDSNWLTEGDGFRKSQMTGFSDPVTFYAVQEPKINVLLLQNMTFNSTSVDLSFLVSEKTPQIAYSLDAQLNKTVAGNTTLTDLSVGGHNVTVYAWDVYGNVGVSETAHFSIAIRDSFPIVPAFVASAISVVVIFAVLLIYFKKIKTRLNSE